jgi:hypothetical protein
MKSPLALSSSFPVGVARYLPMSRHECLDRSKTFPLFYSWLYNAKKRHIVRMFYKF